jgi:aspartate/methionine/tyrosine aminotransferase
MISERARRIGVSQTLKISEKAKQMRREGIDVIDLSVGEPDFPTPLNVKEAGKKAIDENFTKYTASEGIIELKEAIIERIKDDYGLEYKKDEVLVSCGAKHSLYNAILAIVEKGDEVIVPSPYWVSYPEMVSLADGKVVFLEALEENSFCITEEQLKSSISPSTKAIILNNPSNPTGAAYSRDALEKIVKILEDEDLIIISDEIYSKLIYDDFKFISFPSLSEKIKRKTILINGVSKAYSMTGWRIGFALGPKEIIDAMAKIQSHSTSNPTSISQKAALEALKAPQYEVNKMVQEFQRRRNFVLQKLQTIQNISCAKPKGAFYVFPNVEGFYGKEGNGMVIRNSYGMAYYLLKEARVACVPGAAFGNDKCIRISYATSMENLEKGMERIKEALLTLKVPKKVKKLKLQNYFTKEMKNPSIEAGLQKERWDGILKEALSYFKPENYYEWNANINGLVIQLRTNISHLYDFWIENWYPAQLEENIEPHGIIYAVDGVQGREPYGFYNFDTKSAVIFNCDRYGFLRKVALSLVNDLMGKVFETHGVRAFSLDFQGLGLLFLGPKGTKKTEIFYSLLKEPQVMLHSIDFSFIRYGAQIAAADQPERKIFIPTNQAENFPEVLPKLFDYSKCENVVMKKEYCEDSECLLKDDCRLDRGSPYCYKGSKDSHCLLDPYWISGMKKHCKRIDVRYVFILTKDPLSPPLKKLEPEEGLKAIEISTEYEGNRPLSFYNPYIFSEDNERIELERKFFRKLFKIAEVYSLNSGKIPLEESLKNIKNLLK